jgi:hypothetical protein
MYFPSVIKFRNFLQTDKKTIQLFARIISNRSVLLKQYGLGYAL